MEYERRLEAYEKLEKMDWLAKKKLKAKAFLRKYPNLKQAIGSYAYDHHHSAGEDETISSAFCLAMDLQDALIKDGLTDATEEEFLQEVLEPNHAAW
jgi:ABC-type histidine transport system ATPase subunit